VLDLSVVSDDIHQPGGMECRIKYDARNIVQRRQIYAICVEGLDVELSVDADGMREEVDADLVDRDDDDILRFGGIIWTTSDGG
jgi:hypothetical protein